MQMNRYKKRDNLTYFKEGRGKVAQNNSNNKMKDLPIVSQCLYWHPGANLKGNYNEQQKSFQSIFKRSIAIKIIENIRLSELVAHFGL